MKMNERQVWQELWRRLHIDLWLFIGLVVITGYGMLVLYSASGANEAMFQSRIIQVILGFTVMLVMAQLSPNFYKRIAPYLFGLGIAMLILVDLIGATSKGAQRWLDLGIVRFQPSEIVKLAVPLMVAVYLGNRPQPIKLKETFIALIIIIVPTLLVAVQPDLGTSVLVSGSGLFVIFLAGMSWWLILAAIIGLAGFIPIMWFWQSKIAIGSGGLWGKGWMQGTQSQLEFLPEPHTDFIFAVLSEEYGMVGFLILLAIYLFIIARGLMIGVSAQSAFGRILVGALTLIFFVYVFVNIGMVSGILPVVGVPLPLVSYGGTSYVAIMAGFGLIMSIHTHKEHFLKGTH